GGLPWTCGPATAWRLPPDGGDVDRAATLACRRFPGPSWAHGVAFRRPGSHVFSGIATAAVMHPRRHRDVDRLECPIALVLVRSYGSANASRCLGPLGPPRSATKTMALT